MQYQEGYVFDDRYELKQYKGSGSFGEVWLALDRQTEVEVAVKIYIAMDQRGMEEFKKEFQVSFELNHTNLLHANYLEISKADNRPYLVMPFCPQGSVTKYQGTMTEEQVWVFLRDVARGLEYLHKQDPPIVHQDIKPENILIAKSGDYVITDFGISHKVRNNMRKASAHLNSAGAVAYMGPERFEAGYSSMMASDIWSLGVTLYELIMGDVPFCGMGGGMLKQGAEYPDLPMEFSKELDQTMKACLSLNTWDRPTAEDLADYAMRKVKGEEATASWLKAEDSRLKDVEDAVSENPTDGGTDTTPAGENSGSPAMEEAADTDANPSDETQPTGTAPADASSNEAGSETPATGSKSETFTTPQPWFKKNLKMLIGIAAVVVIAIIGLAVKTSHDQGIAAREKFVQDSIANAQKLIQENIRAEFGRVYNDASELNGKSDMNLDNENLLISSLQSVRRAEVLLEEYEGEERESFQNRLDNLKSKVLNKLTNFINVSYQNKTGFEDSFKPAELDVDFDYLTLLKRIIDCERAYSDDGSSPLLNQLGFRYDELINRINDNRPEE